MHHAVRLLLRVLGAGQRVVLRRRLPVEVQAPILHLPQGYHAQIVDGIGALGRSLQLIMQLLIDIWHDLLHAGGVRPARVHGHKLALAGVGLGKLFDHAHLHPLIPGVLDAAGEALEHEDIVVLEWNVVHAGGGDVDDSGLFVQQRKELLGQVVDAENIYGVVDLHTVLVEQVFLDDVASVVHQDVNSVHLGLYLRDDLGQVLLHAQLPDDQVHVFVACSVDDLLLRGLGLLLVAADHVDFCALGSSEASGLVADATGGARDQVVDILEGALKWRVLLVLLGVHVVEVQLHVELGRPDCLLHRFAVFV